MFRYVVVALGALGLYGLLALMGVFQGTAFVAVNHAVSWSFLLCCVFGLVAMLKVRT